VHIPIVKEGRLAALKADGRQPLPLPFRFRIEAGWGKSPRAIPHFLSIPLAAATLTEYILSDKL
jgi:hypothetical protein